MLPLIRSALPPEPPLLSVWTPLPEFVILLPMNEVPFDQFDEIASLAPLTLLSSITPEPSNANIAIDASSAWTFSTVSWLKLNVPPEEA